MNNDSAVFANPVSQICLSVDSETLAIFMAHAEMTGQAYQALMSEALKQVADGLTLVDMLDEAIRQEDA